MPKLSGRVLLACFEIPGWGGASTFTYTLFERMQRDGLDVQLVNLVADHDRDMLRSYFNGPTFGNPYSLDAVQTCFLEGPVFTAQPQVQEIIRTARPDLVFACGYVGAWVMKHSAPDLPLAFFTSGCAAVKRLLRTHAIQDYAEFQRSIARGVCFPVGRDDPERVAVERSDLIIIHSPIVRTAYEHFYPSHIGKVYERDISIADCVYAEAERWTHLARPFEERDIDAIFIASNWLRAEKNDALLERIVRRCGGAVHIVGANPSDGLPVTKHGVISKRKALFELLGRSKTLVSPSAWDPAPGVLFEASAMGCNIVASRNAGNWQLCHEQLVADSAESFVHAIARARTARYADNRARFRGGYADLLDTLAAFL